jgi:hypothetical protein
MPNLHKANLLESLRDRFGELRKLSGSESLFTVGDDAAWLYVRYSKIHPGGRTFFGLRDADLRQLGLAPDAMQLELTGGVGVPPGDR